MKTIRRSTLAYLQITNQNDDRTRGSFAQRPKLSWGGLAARGAFDERRTCNESAGRLPKFGRQQEIDKGLHLSKPRQRISGLFKNFTELNQIIHSDHWNLLHSSSSSSSSSSLIHKRQSTEVGEFEGGHFDPEAWLGRWDLLWVRPMKRWKVKLAKTQSFLAAALCIWEFMLCCCCLMAALINYCQLVM